MRTSSPTTILAVVTAALAAACGASGPAPEQSASAAAPEPGASRRAPLSTDRHSELIGQPAPGWSLATWFNSPPLALEDLRGRVVLVRWFMDPSCPMCSATAPGLVSLDARYRDRGLTVIGMYHHKADTPLDPEDVRGYLAHYGYTFPAAIDADWQTLRRWWLDGHERPYTSVSFVIDRRGVVRDHHEGGKLVGAELARIEKVIVELLAEPAE